ncbi:hypothetical protein CLOP_g8229 [Closterium sp. NIES-67]|nr:hypothetical protein CLOP_g8229 [Closterium sp. NIES-67]
MHEQQQQTNSQQQQEQQEQEHQQQQQQLQQQEEQQQHLRQQEQEQQKQERQQEQPIFARRMLARQGLLERLPSDASTAGNLASVRGFSLLHMQAGADAEGEAFAAGAAAADFPLGVAAELGASTGVSVGVSGGFADPAVSAGSNARPAWLGAREAAAAIELEPPDDLPSFLRDIQAGGLTMLGGEQGGGAAGGGGTAAAAGVAGRETVARLASMEGRELQNLLRFGSMGGLLAPPLTRLGSLAAGGGAAAVEGAAAAVEAAAAAVAGRESVARLSSVDGQGLQNLLRFGSMGGCWPRRLLGWVPRQQQLLRLLVQRLVLRDEVPSVPPWTQQQQPQQQQPQQQQQQQQEQQLLLSRNLLATALPRVAPPSLHPPIAIPPLCLVAPPPRPLIPPSPLPSAAPSLPPPIALPELIL